MRMLFWPNRIGFNLSNSPLPSKVGMPVGVASTARGILSEIASVSINPGNMVHVEAPAKMFACNRAFSCFAGWQVPGGEGEEEGGAAVPARRFNRLFDAACFSFANILKDYRSESPDRLKGEERTWTKLADFVNHMEIPLYVFGVGLQDDLPSEPSAIPPALYALMQAFNRKTKLFGVRGETTARWLHSVGIDKAVPLGCPSLYVYPRNVLSVTAPQLGRDSVLGSAGRLQGGPKHRERMRPLKAVADSFPTDYVFQNDFIAMTRQAPDEVLFDDATGLVDPDFVRQRTRQMLGYESPFRRHYFFRDTNRWRAFAHMRDAFVGDRFHGGVVFLQTGKPALILQADARVKELTGFLGIPTLALQDLGTAEVREAVSRALSPEAIGRFHETYRMRLGNFVQACEEAGLTFADRGAIGAALGETQPAALMTA